MKYLIKTTEQYRISNEEEAIAFINEEKKSNKYTVSKYSSELKTTKQKGEVIDEWYRVTITKDFSDEKDPYGNLMPVYEESKRETTDED